MQKLGLSEVVIAFEGHAWHTLLIFPKLLLHWQLLLFVLYYSLIPQMLTHWVWSSIYPRTHWHVWL